MDARHWKSKLGGLGSAALGVFLVIEGCRGLYESFSSGHWPTVPGKIVAAEVVKEQDRTRITFDPTVKYDYTVDGKPYTGNRIRLSSVGYTFQESAQTKLESFLVNETVKVAYNPNDPSASLLEPGGDPAMFLPLLGGLVFFVIGAVWLAEATKKTDDH